MGNIPGHGTNGLRNILGPQIGKREKEREKRRERKEEKKRMKNIGERRKKR